MMILIAASSSSMLVRVRDAIHQSYTTGAVYSVHRAHFGANKQVPDSGMADTFSGVSPLLGNRVLLLPWSMVGNPDGGQQIVSGNERFYTAKMAELRAYRASSRPLHLQLQELLEFVWKCEAEWNSFPSNS
jgi:hypothetical protein